MIQFLNDTYLTLLLSVFAGLASFMWSFYKYFDSKKREQDLIEFEHYHKLIKELVEPDNKGNIYLDRQIAIVYELRHFKRYYPLSLRTLEGLKQEWKGNQKLRLLNEFDLTINYLKKKVK